MRVIDRELGSGEVLLEGKGAAKAVGVHVVMRQNFIPRVAFDAELEIAVPDSGRNA